MRRKRIGAALAGLFLLMLGTLWDFQRAVERRLSIAGDTVFEIAKGASLREIAGALAERGIIRRPLWFVALAYRRGEAGKLKYGEYLLKPAMEMGDLLALFVSGRVRQHALTIVEGWTTRQLLAALAAQPALDHQVSGKSPQEVWSALGYPAGSAEGRFFPDTYLFPKGFRDIDLLRRAVSRMDGVLDAEWRARAPGLPYTSAYEALILASIVEKETAKDHERPRVAGVFIRRLERRMRLQTDPTVIYGMGEHYSGNITLDHLRQDTPYNTYTREGLPPTPIAFPSAASLRAALHPDRGSSLYFVARGDGSHVFSDTLPEHDRAVATFQKKAHD